jgi:hypothetical protein
MSASSPVRARSSGPVSAATVLVAVGIGCLAVGIGCTGPSVMSPPESLIGRPWQNRDEAEVARDGDSEAVAGLSAVLAGREPPQYPGRPLHLLIMSGGGKYGSFTAGVLNGWTAAGNRPTFDVATGVSSGAIIAAYAYLGPKYDRQMAATFTRLRRSDLYRWQPIRGLLRGTGLLTPEPLDRLLAEQIDEEVMNDLRAAHAEGRRLYVGTGNVLTNRFTIWDIGAIASSGRPDAARLVRTIFLAACTPPGAVEPVPIEVEVNGVRYTEWHADAGNMLQAFVRTPAGIPPGSTFWVLSAGKFYRDPVRGRARFVELIGGAVSNSLYALFRSDLVKLYALCAVTRSNFRLIALPEDFRGSTSSFAFDPEELSRLYHIGYQLTANGVPWRTTPPESQPGEAAPVRTGTSFVVPAAGPGPTGR